MTAWTKEPWPKDTIEAVKFFKDDGTYLVELTEDDYYRARDCVNGCAGLNPAAYKECITVLQALESVLSSRGVKDWFPINMRQAIQAALAASQEPS